MNVISLIRAGWFLATRILLAYGIGFSAQTNLSGAATPILRPNIWVTDADRTQILQKIETQAWAKTQFEALRERSAERLAQHKADADAYLRSLPWVDTERGAHPTVEIIPGNQASLGTRSSLQTVLQAMVAHAIDCGVLYYLTEDPAYAQVSGDVLQAVVQGLLKLTPNMTESNGGWLYPNDHLYEARILGAQLPILYDFAASYLRRPGVTVWDLARRQRVPFDFAAAQEVFRTYTRLAVDQGMSNSNWPVLEMPSLTHNALALEDATERAKWLSYVTHVDAERQDPLDKIIRDLNEAGGVWPESFNYASHVAANVTYIVTLLQRNPGAADFQLPANVASVSRSMLRINEFRYPNRDLVRFGDGSRRANLHLFEVEMAYMTAVRSGDTNGMAEFGGVVTAAIADGSHDRARLGGPPRGANVYLAPVSLLWFSPQIEVPARVAPPAAVTDHLPFAGLVLQRNLATDAKPEHGLMATVHGASFIHGFASGMSIELYGAGHVLVADAGKGTYTTDEHENYRRIFAGHNSVIVNGSSSSEGRWANLGTDTVTPVAMEPAPKAAPASPHHSFTLTRFIDQQVAGTKAEQERTVGIVRTSERGGYYVDVFRSRIMEGGKAGQFHDYVFHHLGDQVELGTASGPLNMIPALDRFQPAAGTEWRRNGTFRFPGWHFFKDAAAATSAAPLVVADFFASKLGETGIGGRLYVPSAPGREYAQAVAPATTHAPGGYDKLSTPVVVIRQKGEAWARPFAAVYETYIGKKGENVIRDVRTLESDGQVAGLVVDGASNTGVFRHYVLTPEPGRLEVRNGALGLHFKGRYAWVAVDEAGEPKEIYVGEGTELSYRDLTLRRADGDKFAARAQRTPDGWRITSPGGDAVRLITR